MMLWGLTSLSTTGSSSGGAGGGGGDISVSSGAAGAAGGGLQLSGPTLTSFVMAAKVCTVCLSQLLFACRNYCSPSTTVRPQLFALNYCLPVSTHT